MAKILDMPKLSPTMEEGVLVSWHKKEGDAVEVDDLLAEVETDKATMEFRAFDKGTLLKLLVTPGTEVKLGQAVAILGAAGEDVSALVAKAASGAAAPARAASATVPAPQGPPQASVGVPTPPSPVEIVTPRNVGGPITEGSLLTRTERDAADAADAASVDDGANGGRRVLASPFVRKAARERGINLTGARGTGEHGRILPLDLDALATRAGDVALVRQTGGAMTAEPRLSPPEVRPLSPMRKTIARRLTQSKTTIPHFYLTVDVDVTELVRFRAEINAELLASAPKGDEGDKPLKVSINDLLIKACATALSRVPECNAQFTDDAILVHSRVDVSVAVAVAEGLVTPVIRNADAKGVAAIAREVRELAARARAKKLKPEEMSDGTFSISNLGMFGIDAFSAVINPPEGAILAVGQVRDEAVVRDGQLAAGKKLSLTLSCDHRVIDGAVGAAFLAELRALLERPMRILTG